MRDLFPPRAATSVSPCAAPAMMRRQRATALKSSSMMTGPASPTMLSSASSSVFTPIGRVRASVKTPVLACRSHARLSKPMAVLSGRKTELRMATRPSPARGSLSGFRPPNDKRICTRKRSARHRGAYWRSGRAYSRRLGGGQKPPRSGCHCRYTKARRLCAAGGRRPGDGERNPRRPRGAASPGHSRVDRGARLRVAPGRLRTGGATRLRRGYRICGQWPRPTAASRGNRDCGRSIAKNGSTVECWTRRGRAPPVEIS